jgi:hypothetical protein
MVATSYVHAATPERSTSCWEVEAKPKRSFRVVCRYQLRAVVRKYAMTWYPDKSTVTMVDWGDHIRAVGWLSAEHPFPKGGVPAGFLNRLRVFATKWGASTTALGWGFFMGSHACELCEMGPPPWRRFRASGNIGVPDVGLLFVAPEMIAHYVEVHQYRPPDEYIAATMKCPTPGTEEYQAMVQPFRHLHQKNRERKFS